jgi:hypothetical protein
VNEHSPDMSDERLCRRVDERASFDRSAVIGTAAMAASSVPGTSNKVRLQAFPSPRFAAFSLRLLLVPNDLTR